MQETYFIYYVRDQAASAAYYRKVLGLEPIVDVAGITEFSLRDGTVLAFMPVASAERMLGNEVVSTSSFPATPKAEVYLVVDDPGRYHRRALANGGREVSPMQERDWGHRAAYSIDADGHVLAFAEKIGS